MTTDIQARPDRTIQGVILIVLAVFMMSVQDALFKHFSNDLSLWEIYTLRGLIALPLFFIVALIQGQHKNLWGHALRKWSLVRALFMTLMLTSFYAAIPFLSLSTIAAGFYTSPVFVTLLSAFALREPVGSRGWIASFMGFSGVLFILQPGSDAFTFWTVVPVLGGFFYALSNITTRSKCQNEPVTALSLSVSLVLLLMGILMSGVILLWQPTEQLISRFPYLLSDWSEVSQLNWLIITLLAALLVGIGMALAGAYQATRPSIVATFDYSYLIFAALWDYLFFSTVPSVLTVFGMILIICAGLLVTRR